jgi:hypothetical protein
MLAERSGNRAMVDVEATPHRLKALILVLPGQWFDVMIVLWARFVSNQLLVRLQYPSAVCLQQA